MVFAILKTQFNMTALIADKKSSIELIQRLFLKKIVNALIQRKRTCFRILLNYNSLITSKQLFL